MTRSHICCQQKWGLEVRLGLVIVGKSHVPEIDQLQSFLADTQEPSSAESHTFSNNVMILNYMLRWMLWKTQWQIC